MAKKIKFYLKDDPYGFMSNFYRAKIMVNGVEYSTSEHYYQCMKFDGVDEDLKNWVKNAPTPHMAFKATRAIGEDKWRKDWKEVNVDIMRTAVYAKFMQHPDLETKLIDTGNAVLIENSPVDSFWGCGKDGDGENWLGKILMEVRATLIKNRKVVVKKNELKIIQETYNSNPKPNGVMGLHTSDIKSRIVKVEWCCSEAKEKLELENYLKIVQYKWSTIEEMNLSEKEEIILHMIPIKECPYCGAKVVGDGSYGYD